MDKVHGLALKVFKGAQLPSKDIVATEKLEDRRQAILATLPTLPYQDIKDAIEVRSPETCQWLSNHDRYREWLEHGSSSLLLLTAGPGYGKSVLARYLVDEKLAPTEEKTICYFFFSFRTPKARTASSSLRCILHQIFSQRNELLSKNIVERFELFGNALLSSTAGLCDIMTSVSNEPQAGEIICVFDGYDECEESQRTLLGDALQHLFVDTKGNVKVVVTSRPCVRMSRQFKSCNALVISVQGEKLDGDIHSDMVQFIRHRVAKITQELELNPETSNQLLEAVNSGNGDNKTFLYFNFLLEYYRKQLLSKNGRRLTPLPATLDGVYEYLLKGSSDWPQTEKLFNVVIAASRPLRLTEVMAALEMRDTHASAEQLGPNRENELADRLSEIGVGLVGLSKSKEVYFGHLTALEFLLDGLHSQKKKTEGQWQASLSTTTAHRTLAQICTKFLLLDNFHVRKDIREVVEYAKGCDFDFSNSPDLENLIHRLCYRPWSTHVWFKIYLSGMKSTSGLAEFEDMDDLSIASYFGLRPVVEDMSKSTAYFKRGSTSGLSAKWSLCWAAEQGHADVVKTLIGALQEHIQKPSLIPRKLKAYKLVNINTPDYQGRAPIAHAAMKGHGQVVELLLAAQARHDICDQLGGTPLLYSICSGDQELPSLIQGAYNRPVEASKLTQGLEELLCRASRAGQESLVESLLCTGRVNADGIEGSTPRPLDEAIKGGHKHVVAILLKHGAHIRDSHMQTAFDLGLKDTVQILLNRGFRPDYTFLKRARDMSDGAMVRILIPHTH